MDEVLDEAEAAFESRCAVAEGTLHGVPEGHVGVDEGDDADLHEAFARGAAVALPEEEAEVENGDDDVGEDVDELGEEGVGVFVLGLAEGVGDVGLWLGFG